MALILALLALLLLTAVGLTLATTTSTEVQVAANYRWSLQALYNAEAGLEVAKTILVAAQPIPWVNPPARTTTWDPASVANPAAPPTVTVPGRTGTVTRDFEMGRCDRVGNGMGYGFVMADTTNGGAALENVTAYPVGAGGLPLHGAFTVWYRKPLAYNPLSTLPSGQMRDFGSNPGDTNANTSGSPGTDVTIVVSEGIAPSQSGTSAYATGVGAVQVVEATIYGPPTQPACEADLTGQSGAGSGGAGVDPCAVAVNSFSATSMGVGVKASDQGKTFNLVQR